MTNKGIPDGDLFPRAALPTVKSWFLATKQGTLRSAVTKYLYNEPFRIIYQPKQQQLLQFAERDTIGCLLSNICAHRIILLQLISPW